MQADIKLQEQSIAKLKAQQDDQTQDQLGKLTKAADALGLKLAQQKGALEANEEDLQVRYHRDPRYVSGRMLSQPLMGCAHGSDLSD